MCVWVHRDAAGLFEYPRVHLERTLTSDGSESRGHLPARKQTRMERALLRVHAHDAYVGTKAILCVHVRGYTFI